jgi:hypothetical protein
MIASQTRYEKAVANAARTVGKPAHAHFTDKACAAFEKFDAARHEYASTPQGEEDLRNRLRAALDGRAADTGTRTPDGKPLDNPVDLETAIVTGRLIRQRNERRRQRNAAARPRPALYRATDGEIVRITTGATDSHGIAYLPEGAYVRFRTDIPATATVSGEAQIMVERVRMPGDKGEDEFTAGHERSHNGSIYQIPATAIGACAPDDETAAYFTANPSASGDDYTGYEYLDADEDEFEDVFGPY